MVDFGAEARIMAAIGLGQHWSWHNGNRGCSSTIQNALARLPGALRAERRAGVAIVAVNKAIMRALRNVWLDEPIHRLDRSYGAIAEAIRWHQEASDLPRAERAASAARVAADLLKRFAPGHIPLGRPCESRPLDPEEEYWSDKLARTVKGEK